MADLMQQARELANACEQRAQWGRGSAWNPPRDSGGTSRLLDDAASLMRELAALRAAPTGTDEYLAYLEAAVDEAGFVVKHDGGTLGDSNFRLEPKIPPTGGSPTMTDTDRRLMLDVIRVKLATCSDTTVNLVWQLVLRDEAGRAKYGTTMDRTDLTTEQWLQHLTEEALDAAGYAQAAIRTMRTQK